MDILKVLKDAVEEGDNVDGPNLIILLTSDLERLLAQGESHVERGGGLALRVGELDSLEALRLLVHQVDDEGEAAVQIVVQNASIFHDRLDDQLEEVPHALAHTLLVVDELAKTGQTLIGALRSIVIESGPDGRLEHLLELRIHLGVSAGDGLKNAPDGGHDSLRCQTRLLVQVELVRALSGLLLLVQTEEGFTKLAAEVEGMGSNLVFEHINDLLKRVYEFIVVDVIDELQVDPDHVRQARTDELNSSRVIEKLDQGDSCVDAHRKVGTLQALVEGIQSVAQMVLIRKVEVGELAVDPARSRLHEAILGLELWEDILLDHQLCISLVLLRVGHVLGEESKGVEEGLSVAEVFTWGSLQVLDEQLEVVGQVVTDLVLPRLADIADGLDQVLINSFHVPRVRIVDLKADILHWVLRPQLELVLADEQKRQGQLEKDRLDVLLAELSHLGLVQGCSNES